jgi:hypothetical protein
MIEAALRFKLHDDRLLYDRAHLLQSSTMQVLTLPMSPRDSAQYTCREYYGPTTYYPDEPSKRLKLASKRCNVVCGRGSLGGTAPTAATGGFPAGPR